MNEILNNYKLFMVVFITLLLIVLVLYNYLFEIENRDKNLVDLKQEFKNKDESLNLLEQDIKKFQKFNKILPPVAGSIFFLRNNDMTMVFHKRGLDGLYTFYNACKDKQYTFNDEELERLKDDLYLAIERYISTFELSSKEMSSGYFKVLYNLDDLHLSIDDLLQKYDKFTSVSKKKLDLL